MNCFYLWCVVGLLGWTFAKTLESEPPYYNEQEILAETKWKALAVQENAPNHLSVISQGFYNEDLVGAYDKNYYYPASAGQDIDIFVFDGGFIFDNADFANASPKGPEGPDSGSGSGVERTAKCLFFVEYGNVTLAEDPYRCFGHQETFHGMLTSITAGGLEYGVAKKANVYGVVVHYDEYDDEEYPYFYQDVVAGLRYIRQHYFRPHQAVFNFSFGNIYNQTEYEEKRAVLEELQTLISEMSEEGAVFVAAAGNESTNTAQFDQTQEYNVPCDMKDVISVGGIQNNRESEVIVMPNDGTYTDEMWTDRYKVDRRSNYGARVDLYAPFWMHYIGVVYFEELVYQYVVYGLGVDLGHVTPYQEGYLTEEIEFIISGTSFSSPTVAGIAATIMGEHPEWKFTTQRMLDYLTGLGEKNIIQGVPADAPNVYVNNGKRTVYARDGLYQGCGPRAGRQTCPAADDCCSAEGYCIASSSSSSSSSSSLSACSLREGCQPDYGRCLAQFPGSDADDTNGDNDDADADNDADANANVDSASDSDSDAEVEVDIDADADANANVDSDSDVDADAEAEVDAEVDHPVVSDPDTRIKCFIKGKGKGKGKMGHKLF